MHKTKWDKIISGIMLVVSVIWFIIQKLTGFFSSIGLEEINDIIPFIAVFSVFCMVWSFIWDQKIDCLYKNIQVYESDYNNKFLDARKELKGLLVAELSKPQLIESKILFEHETNLIKYLSLRQSSSDYAQIYVITNDVEVENDDYGDVICTNIINNHQYVYMTPFEENAFMEKLCETLFQKIPHNIDKSLLGAAIQKNIRHIQNKDFFKILPESSNMVIYQKKQQIAYNDRNAVLHGFYSFQNGPIRYHDINSYFYNTMTYELASKIVNYIENLTKEKEKINLSSTNYITKKAEVRKSEEYMCNGLFCKTAIEPGEVILKKGGRFILKKNLDKDLFLNVMYVQVSADYVVSSLTPGEDMTLGFPINHNCRHPNCCFKSAIEIVATRRINPGEEILIDYAYFDPEYAKFTCKGCDNCIRTCLSEEDIKKELQKKDVLIRVSPYLKILLQEQPVYFKE